jgi:hypothetical protein
MLALERGLQLYGGQFELPWKGTQRLEEAGTSRQL